MDKNLLNKILKKIFYILIGISGAIGTIIVSSHIFFTLLNSIFGKNFDYQILLLLFGAIIIITTFWGLFLVKIKTMIKIPILIILLFLQFSFIEVSVKLPSVNKIVDINLCIDRGYCWDSVHNRCEMHDWSNCLNNEKVCKYHNGIWQADKQYCILPEKYRYIDNNNQQNF